MLLSVPILSAASKGDALDFAQIFSKSQEHSDIGDTVHFMQDSADNSQAPPVPSTEPMGSYQGILSK